jgi:hypothetical protein
LNQIGDLLTDEIDDDSPVAEAAGGVTEECLAVRRLVDPHRHHWSRHDEGVAGVNVGVSEGEHGGDVA